MNTTLVAAGITVGIMILGLVIAYWVANAKRRNLETIGHLIVDAKDPEEGGGVYLQIEIDPKMLKDKEIVQLEVFKLRD